VNEALSVPVAGAITLAGRLRGWNTCVMAEVGRGERGLSRRALFGLGASRVAERVDGYRADLEAAGRAAGAAATTEPFDSGWDLPDDAGASALLAPAAEALVEACGVRAGERVLDCASGDGNVALAAARRGARAIALDSSAVALGRGRERARAEGLEIDWIEGDAQSLSLAARARDPPHTAVGVVWADDARGAIAELFRVARPGGTVGIAAWTSGGLAGQLLRTAAEHVPLAPPGTPLPTAWGREERLRQDLEQLADDLRSRPAQLSLEGAGSAWQLVSSSPGPIAAGVRALAPERLDALRMAIETLAPNDDGPLATRYLELVASVAAR